MYSASLSLPPSLSLCHSLSLLPSFSLFLSLSLSSIFSSPPSLPTHNLSIGVTSF